MARVTIEDCLKTTTTASVLPLPLPNAPDKSQTDSNRLLPPKTTK